MKINNPWVGYLDRSYLQIKNSLLQRLGEKVPEVTDHSESNILVIILSMFSGVAEMLNYYIDNMAREAFITTARRYSSVVRHTRLIDYRIKAAIPSTTDLTLTFLGDNNEPAPSLYSFNIPSGTRFYTNNNINFITTRDIIVPPGIMSVTLPVEQKDYKSNMYIGLVETTNDPIFSLGDNYVNDSLNLMINGIPWERVDTLGLSKPTDKHFIIDVSVDKLAYIRFGDNINGARPELGSELIGEYYTTQGSKGNVLNNTITNTNFDISTLSGRDFKVNNLLGSTGGSDYEGIERLKRSAPLHLRTLNRAVTPQDYVDIALLAPGVDKAKIKHSCGNNIELYISPNYGGIATTLLLENTERYFDDKKTVGTIVEARPAGISEIVLTVNVTARFRRSIIQTREDINNALLERYSYNNSDINMKVRVSDVIAIVDNLEKVDYLDLVNIYLKPYIRPNNHHEALNGYIDILPNSTERLKWKLQYDGAYMRLYKNMIHVSNITVGEIYNDPEGIIKVTILPSNYLTGQEWEFITEPYNVNIETEDFSVPILKPENLVINVKEQITAN